MKQKKQKLPKRKQPFFSFVKKILRLFYKKPKVVCLSGDFEEPSIILSNHVALKGPVLNELYLPVFHATWGAGEMLGHYKMRYDYLRNVFYIKKLGMGKARATLRATFAAMFSKPFYRGMKVLPTWQDSRLFKTVSHSIDILNDGTSVLIFPENSDEGYKDILTEFHAGFVTLAECYYKKTGKDVPVYPVYYHDKAKVTLVGEPKYVQDYVNKGLTRDEVAEEFRKIVNGLHDKIEAEYMEKAKK